MPSCFVSYSTREPHLDLDKHFSDVKDVAYAEWNRFEIKGTVHTIWDEYRKKKNEIRNYIEIPEPQSWQ